jgi:NADPH:quinone reductase-like Zn-dependent oxidoreductase
MANSATSARVTRQFVFSRSSPEGIKLVTKPAASLSKDLDKVLLRVVCAGINPVDAKGLVGDKFPGWMNSVGAYFFPISPGILVCDTMYNVCKNKGQL